MKTLFDESLAGNGHQNEKSFEAGSIRRSPYRMAEGNFHPPYQTQASKGVVNATRCHEPSSPLKVDF